MTRRLRATGLALAILVFGLGLVVAATEYAARADAAESQLLTIADVGRVLGEQGVNTERSEVVHHQRLNISGTQFTFGVSSLEVYVYRTIPDRVADEQIVQGQIMGLQALLSDGDRPFRVTSARNVLLIYHAESARLAASIQEAARSLTLGADI